MSSKLRFNSSRTKTKHTVSGSKPPEISSQLLWRYSHMRTGSIMTRQVISIEWRSRHDLLTLVNLRLADFGSRHVIVKAKQGSSKRQAEEQVINKWDCLSSVRIRKVKMMKLSTTLGIQAWSSTASSNQGSSTHPKSPLKRSKNFSPVKANNRSKIRSPKAPSRNPTARCLYCTIPLETSSISRSAILHTISCRCTCK